MRIPRICVGLTIVLGLMLLAIACAPAAAPALPSPMPEPTPAPPAGVQVTVRDDIYILPVAELESTRTNPDVVLLENTYVRLSVVGNRGRPIFAYFFKPTGHEALYSATQPRPVRTAAGYVVEFGGYYLSVPWNERDRQPYDLEYEISQRGAERAEVHLWGQNPLTPVKGDMWVTLEQGTSLVTVKVRLANDTDQAVPLKLRDFAVLAPGGGLTGASRLVIPASEVVVGQSQDGWMGADGEAKPWPQPWAEWGQFPSYGSFYVPADRLHGPFAGIINPDTGDTFIKLWEAETPFEKLFVWSWGMGYEDVSGATPTVNFENVMPETTLDPGAALEFAISFYAIRDLRIMAMANDRLAGGVQTDKPTYSIAQDRQMKVTYELGSPTYVQDLELQGTLVDGLGKTVRAIGQEVIPVLSPERAHRAGWAVDLSNAELKPGRYAIQVNVFDAGGEALFSMTSAPIELQ